MERINSSQLKGSLVETQEGRRLGTLRDFDLDTGTLRVLKLHVVPVSLVKRLTGKHMLIDVSAVIDVQPGLIIVEEAVVPTSGSPLEATNLHHIPKATPSGVIQSKT